MNQSSYGLIQKIIALYAPPPPLVTACLPVNTDLAVAYSSWWSANPRQLLSVSIHQGAPMVQP